MIISDVRLIDGVAERAREHVDVAIDGDGSSVYSLFERLCRLDPLQAMKVRPAQSG